MILLILCLVELALPNAFEILRSTMFGLFGAEDSFTKLEAHYRRAQEMFFIRPQFIFSEPSNYAKFVSILISFKLLAGNNWRQGLSYITIFFFLIRSPSILIPLPLIVMQIFRTKLNLKHILFLLIVTSLLAYFFSFYLIARYEAGFLNQSRSEMERIVLPILYLYENPSILFFGLSPGNLSYLGEYQCFELKLNLWTDIDCYNDPPSAFNAFFGMLASYGITGLIFLFFISLISGASKASLSFIFFVCWVGLIMAGYNMPKFMILVTINACIFYMIMHSNHRLINSNA